MSLQPGQSLLHYRIEAAIGKGGMGEVYRARDTRLGRSVALKLLPEALRADPQRLARLEREARLLASLNHPHIATLHGLEQSDDNTRFLVMELVDGETLASKLEHGALPLEQVYTWGAQIAGALAAAHEKGVIHRDLKPGNIMLTSTGVKLLDFGLARSERPPPVGTQAPTETPGERSPSITSAGAILGTFQYMSPEQLEGGEADRRTDIFSLGSVLYEMATGRRPFQGKSTASLIAAILAREPPPLDRGQPLAPAAFDRVVRTCLAKDPEGRWQSARDLQLELTWLAEAGKESTSGPDSPVAAGRRLRGRLGWLAAAVFLVASVILALRGYPPPVSPIPTTRFRLSLPEGTSTNLVRVSPDGRYVSSEIWSGSQPRIWLRPLGDVSARALPGTENVRTHFWSPDSRHIGFISDGKLRKIDVTGGLPETICEAPGSGPSQFGAWGWDGTILFGVAEAPGQASGLYRVADSGGLPALLIPADVSGDELVPAWPFWPHFMPDGRHFLSLCDTAAGDHEQPGGICVISLETGQARRLLHVASYAEYAPPGYLLYAQGGVLLAQPFDAGRLTLDGNPLPLLDGVRHWQDLGVPSFSASMNGVLVTQRQGGGSRLALVDRTGKELRQVGSVAHYQDMHLSPDQRKVAATIEDPRTGTEDVWIIEMNRNVASRFTTGDGDAGNPVWSPDGDRIALGVAKDHPPNLHVKPLSGGEAQELLPSRGTLQWATDWSRDGRFILYSDRDPTTGWDIWILPLEGKREPAPFLRTRFQEWGGVFSPDGRWIAYRSDEAGRPEVYVRPFDGHGEKLRVSTEGGSQPRWPGEGKELFYRSADGHLMAVPVTLGDRLELGAPHPLFAIQGAREAMLDYDVSADGQRFVVSSALAGTDAGPMVVLNWTAELAAQADPR